MTAYYNDTDEYAAAWLRNAIDAGLIAPGVVDTRSIVDVRPSDLKGFVQVHLFAGIGGWSLAARIAGWPDTRPLWTGSCPCQPYSAAGKRKGAQDARNLWPEMRRLVSACRPAVVAGEQVASKDGRIWLDGIRTDAEDMAYAFWAADTCAAGAGAPHIRQRLYWLADAAGERRVGLRLRPEAGGRNAADLPEAAGSGATGGLADANGRFARHRHLQSSGQHGQQPQDCGVAGRLGDTGHERLEGGDARTMGCQREAAERTGALSDRRMADAGASGWEALQRASATDGRPQVEPDGYGHAFWSRYDVVQCTDGKARRFEPGSFPLAHGVSNRVGRLRAYGNAIVPQVAAQVLGAYLDGRGLRVTPVSDVSDDGVFA